MEVQCANQVMNHVQQPRMVQLDVLELADHGQSRRSFSLWNTCAQSKEHLLSNKQWQWRKFRLIAVVMLLGLCIAGVLALTAVYIGGQEPPFDYAMIFDAGSSHTDMVLYKWQANKFRGTGIVSQVHSCENKGGVAKVLRRNPAALAAGYLERCLREGLNFVPADRRAHSPVFLAGTAGMRLLQAEDPEVADHILGNLSAVLQGSGLLLAPNGVRIISGAEEAVAGWISANYLLHTLQERENPELVGMLDLGGASAQVAFPSDAHSSSSSSVTLYGTQHRLHARSYLCFGSDEAARRYLALLVLAQGNDHTGTSILALNVSSPCHNVGYTETMVSDRFVDSCSETYVTDQLRNITIILTGSGDSEKCVNLTRSLLDKEICEANFKKCFDAPPPPSPSTRFAAVSGFWYVMKSIHLENRTADAPSITEFLDAVREKCLASWEDLKRMADFNELYTPNECFAANYASALLLYGYKITSETWSNLKFLKRIEGASVGWTLGFAIWNTNAIPAEEASTSIPTLVLTSLTVLIGFSSALLVTCCLKLRREKPRLPPEGKTRTHHST